MAAVLQRSHGLTRAGLARIDDLLREHAARREVAGAVGLIARTDTGAVVLSGAARRIEIHNVDGEVVTSDPIRVTESFSATTESSDIKVDFADTAPRTVDATSQDGDVIIALPAQTLTFASAFIAEDAGLLYVEDRCLIIEQRRLNLEAPGR